MLEVKDFVTGDNTLIPLAGPANRQGRIIADNIHGLNSTYKNSQGTSVLKIFNMTVAGVGNNEKQLKQKFTPEFLNRIDKIVYFNTLSDDNLREIVKLEINKFGKRLKEIKYNIKYDDSVVNYIHEQALKQKEYGARPIIRLVQNNLEDAITDLILENDYEPEYAFSATCVNNHISIS